MQDGRNSCSLSTAYRRDSLSMNMRAGCRGKALGRIRRLVVERHAEVQVLAALEIEDARQARHAPASFATVNPAREPQGLAVCCQAKCAMG